uniref:GIY-YIG endonuclease n=1 Tax=Coniophora olivacea TaxID=85977 RepID=A0A896Z2P5_9AGAM
MFTAVPSDRLEYFLKEKNITNYVHAMEYEPKQVIDQPVKSTLNSKAGTYLCINLVNGKKYVGSASQGGMYNRYCGHLLGGHGGSQNVKAAVKKYGIENFAFLVLETNENGKIRDEILATEQKYIDLLMPEYNIALFAGSVLNSKWSQDSRDRLVKSETYLKRMENLRLARKNTPVSEETRELLRANALERGPVSDETKLKMSINNNKSVAIQAYLADSDTLYREFLSIAEAAEHFFNDRDKRGPIKYALAKNTKILNKYYLRKS